MPAGSDAAFRELYPFTPKTISHDGVKQSYVDEGSGHALVMVHGNPTWSFFFRDMIKSYRDSFRCIVPDHVGCGLSDKPQTYPYTLKTHADNLERLIDHALPNGEPVSLVLHDWGGAVGMRWATRWPKRVKRIVAMNTAAWNSLDAPKRILLCRWPVIGDVAVRGFNLFARLATSQTTVKPLSAAVRAGYLRPYDSWANRVAVLRFVRDIPVSPAVPSYAELADIEAKFGELRDVPAYFPWGARDWCFTTKFLPKWRGYFPNSRENVYEDAGHYLLEDAGDRIIPAVREFLSADAT